MLLTSSILVLFAASSVSAASVPARSAPAKSSPSLTPLPLVIWHGLGDDFTRDGLQELADLAESTVPGTYVRLVRLGDTAGSDRQATFLGNVTEQLDDVCTQLASDPILSSAPAINALGLSQGGLFLRAYVQRCNAPPIQNLVTFGSPHNGIAEFFDCSHSSPSSAWACRSSLGLLRFGRWSDFVQSRLVPAQYYRDPNELDVYRDRSNFLADINHERTMGDNSKKKKMDKSNLASLNRLVMYMFEDDEAVIPKESAWFAEVNSSTGQVTPLSERPIYTEDWIGLKGLGEAGRLVFRTAPGAHMQLSDSLLADTFTEFFGPVPSSSPQQQKDRDDDYDDLLTMQNGL